MFLVSYYLYKHNLAYHLIRTKSSLERWLLSSHSYCFMLPGVIAPLSGIRYQVFRQQRCDVTQHVTYVAQDVIAMLPFDTTSAIAYLGDPG